MSDENAQERGPLAWPQGEPEDWSLRMKDLCAASGLSRQTIHFYVNKGLLPPGRKTERNQARYGPVHLERLELIRRLQHERFLPLDAIKALFDDQGEDYSTSQRGFLRELRGRLALEAAEAGEAVDGRALVAAGVVDARDLEELAEAGLVGLRREKDGSLAVPAQDVWLVETLGQLRAAGLSRELGFAAGDLRVFQDAVTGLLRSEAELVSTRLQAESPEEAAAILRRVLPLIGPLLAKLHESRLRDLLDTF
ncbi:MAG: MerR family transcriptional regulator [Alphaproteobacteria bacterium]|nr:MerR family transcriptional regulator [Alphaproteobacteria bacterium]MCB9794259.1 MerR family transcriptional regulator [Alphaproteobacteria bacterium]